MRYGIPVLVTLVLVCAITSAYCLHMEAQWNETADEMGGGITAQSLEYTNRIQDARDTADRYGDYAVVSLAGGFFFEALLLVELVRDRSLQRSSRPTDPA